MSQSIVPAADTPARLAFCEQIRRNVSQFAERQADANRPPPVRAS